MIERQAVCSCGQLQLTARGDPVRISVCHCLACQRRTGSVFGAQARFAQDAVTIEGNAREYVRVADSGNRVIFRFCPDCGATVYYALDAVPGFIAVPIGAFADPQFPAPRISIYEERRHEWVCVPDGAEKLA
jgi:hypothetical protein